MQDFKDKVAVVTGAASGIGLGMTRAFASKGMKLVLADLDQDALDKASTELSASGVEVTTTLCDVSKHEQVQALAEVATNAYGQVNILCNNAGIGIPTATHNMKLADWKWIIDVDLWGPIYGVEVFLPLIEATGEGHINSTSSMAGMIAARRMGAYNVAKHGVIALMASLERELRARKSPVTASVLCPGPINTNISFNSVTYRPGGAKPKSDGKTSGAMAKEIQAALEQGMQPDDVGKLVLNAIESNKFWVLTHPRWTKTVQKQLDAMNADQSLTKA